MEALSSYILFRPMSKDDELLEAVGARHIVGLQGPNRRRSIGMR